MVSPAIRIWLMNYTKSLLSREYSTWLKGLLTLLIVLGHDMVFTIPLKEYGVMGFLYIFHIQSFFLLPFLYGVDTKAYTLKRVGDMFVRFYWPYCLFALLMMLCYGVASNFASFTWSQLLRLLIICDATSIKEMCGIQILWFLPCMMSMTLLRELYYRNGMWVRFTLLLISVLYITCSTILRGPALSGVHQLLRYVPFGTGYAMQLFAQGVILRALIYYINKKKKYVCVLAASTVGFAACCAIYVKYVSVYTITPEIYRIFVSLQNVTPLLFLLMVVSLMNLSATGRKESVIYRMGSRSLYVYLISPFVGYAAYFVCSALGLVYWWLGLLLCPIIVYVAYKISLLITGKLEAFMFPRNYEMLRQCLIRKGHTL